MTSCEHEGLYMLLDSKTHRSLSLSYHYKLVSVHRSFWSLNLSLSYHYKLVSVHRSFWSLNLSLSYHHKLVSVHRSFWSLNTAGTLSKLSTTLTIIHSKDIFFFFSTIFNKGAKYLTFKSIFHKALKDLFLLFEKEPVFPFNVQC